MQRLLVMPLRHQPSPWSVVVAAVSIPSSLWLVTDCLTLLLAAVSPKGDKNLFEATTAYSFREKKVTDLFIGGVS